METKLICPKCKKKLSRINSSYKCEQMHTYDISSEGYVNLTVQKQGSGDTKEMCRARRNFLQKGYYKILAEALGDILTQYGVTSCVDMGCGEGYYDREICKNGAIELYGVDLAKETVRLASKAVKSVGIKAQYAVASIFEMPFEDESFDSALSVFAPVADAEAARVLVSNGIMVVVTPGEKHLDGLKQAIYERPYTNPEKQKQYPEFEVEKFERVTDKISVCKEDIENLFLMTPYYWKTSKEDSAKLGRLEKLETCIDFIITIYRKKGS